MNGNDDWKPRAGETREQYLKRAWRGCWEFLNDPDATPEECTLFLLGAHWARAVDCYDREATERSTGIGVRIIAMAELEAAKHAIRDAEGDLDGPDTPAA